MQIFKNKSQEANNTEVTHSKKRVSFCNFVRKRNSKGVTDIDIEPNVINDESDNRNVSSHENKTGCGFKSFLPRKNLFKNVRKPVKENFAAFDTGFGEYAFLLLPIVYKNS